MYERANYFKNKFIRNGIALFAMSAVLIYMALAKGELIMIGLIVCPLGAIIWLYLGLWINKNLKTKNTSTESSEITDERISFRQVEFILSILLAFTLILSFRHWEYANYLLIPVVIAYLYWLYSQVKLLNNFFKA